ncbi:putative membrane protein [Mycobacterium kansasii 732]|nr:putative membrane protein [Mycobacterium kansasii 732]
MQRGLPTVLTKRSRLRRLWSRSAPTLAGYAALHCWTLPVMLITHGEDVVIDDNPTPQEWVLLTLIALAPVLIVGVGWRVSRISDSRKRAIAATVAVSVVGVVIVVETDLSRLPDAAIFTALVLLLTASGVGSVVGWALRITVSQFATIGALAVRALPVVLLTTLVFFNGNVWLMAATIGAERLGLAIAFLLSIAAAFVVSTTRERVRPMLQSPAALPRDCERLALTPFATLPDSAGSPPLTRAERVNMVFVLAVSQLVQIMVVALLTAVIYVMLGLIVLSSALLDEWTRGAPSSSTVLGLTFPVPDSLIHMCLFLGALTFMYISARAVDDAEYRTTFVDPLIDDLHATLIARNRYHASITGYSPRVDAADHSD